MAERATVEADRAAAAVVEVPREAGDRPADGVAEFSHALLDLLGGLAGQILEVATALGRAAAWDGVARAQRELLFASLALGVTPKGDGDHRLDQGGNAYRRQRSGPIGELMARRRRVVARPDETVQAAVARMTEQVCGSVLVCDGDRLCGLFTERDLMTRVVGQRLDPGATMVADVMTRDPDRIESTATVREALRRMGGLAQHLPVVENGRALGVLSLHELPADALAGMLPELEQRRVLAERLW